MRHTANRRPLSLVILSDTHGFHEQLQIPDGDVLIHAGDFTLHGALEEVSAFNDFLADLPHRHKLVIGGNHDFCCEQQPDATRTALAAAHYLLDESVTIEGWRFYGSPWQPWFMDMAFNVAAEEDRARAWEQIPADTDVLITHTPPHGILDLTSLGERVGCRPLRQALEHLRPRLHVFGHIHEDYGREERAGTVYVNGCNCTLDYRPTQRPIEVRLAERE